MADFVAHAQRNSLMTLPRSPIVESVSTHRNARKLKDDMNGWMDKRETAAAQKLKEAQWELQRVHAENQRVRKRMGDPCAKLDIPTMAADSAISKRRDSVRRRSAESRIAVNDHEMVLERNGSSPTTEELLEEMEKSRKRIIELKEENDELRTRRALDILTIRELEESKEESERIIRELKEKLSRAVEELHLESLDKSSVKVSPPPTPPFTPSPTHIAPIKLTLQPPTRALPPPPPPPDAREKSVADHGPHPWPRPPSWKTIADPNATPIAHAPPLVSSPPPTVSHARSPNPRALSYPHLPRLIIPGSADRLSVPLPIHQPTFATYNRMMALLRDSGEDALPLQPSDIPWPMFPVPGAPYPGGIVSPGDKPAVIEFVHAYCAGSMAAGNEMSRQWKALLKRKKVATLDQALQRTYSFIVIGCFRMREVTA
jgi:hypothetical protein